MKQKYHSWMQQIRGLHRRHIRVDASDSDQKSANARARDEARYGAKNWELLRSILFAVLLALSFRSLAYEPFHIPSGSMKETLLIGDYLWVSKSAYGYSNVSFPFSLDLMEGRIFAKPPTRGDVAVFRPPSMPKTDFIKRVIGLPGDTVQMKHGQLYINGLAVPKEPAGEFIDKAPDGDIRIIRRFKETLPNGVSYIVLDAWPKNPNRYTDNTDIYVVPEGHYFMMGDNRDNSRDSRVLSAVGFIPFENIVGKAVSLFYSTDGTARIWQPWKWWSAMRHERVFTAIGMPITATEANSPSSEQAPE